MGSRRTGLVGDLQATFLGIVFFAITTGIEKLDPRNVAWLTFGDQRTHWLGWRFFASDQWRWPLGSNPRYGWESMNSIVYTDSWPGMAMIFKLLNLESVDTGQYFGIGLMLGAIALFVGSNKLFTYFGLSRVAALLASGLLATTPIFWWMQRWYPALSSGLPMLVWALYFYFDDSRRTQVLLRRWIALILAAVVTHAYLTVIVLPILFAVLVRRLLKNRQELKSYVITLAIAVGAVGITMYVFGYLTVPSKWAQTGGYGWYSLNLLGPFDLNGASTLLPNIPGLPGQHEPTSLGLGSILLLVILVARLRPSWKPHLVRNQLREHASLVVVLLGLTILAVSNTVSFGSWSVRVPLPFRVEHGLSIFRSSARMFWPTLILVICGIVVFTIRKLRFGVALIALALAVQILDSANEMTEVTNARDGRAIGIDFDRDFWSRVPSSYTTIASLPAASLGFDWATCAFAAVSTNRTGECGYFSRVQGLEAVNQQRSMEVLGGELDEGVIYMISQQWLDEHRDELSVVLAEQGRDLAAAVNVAGFGVNTIFLFPNCRATESCNFLGPQHRTVGNSFVPESD